MEVSAKDKATDRRQSIRISHSSGLTREEIGRMVRDAELHADEDLRKKKLVDARNAADMLVHSTGKTIADRGGQVDPSTLADVENALGDLKDAMKGDDAERIMRLTEYLQRAAQSMAESLYRRSQTRQGDAYSRSDRGSQGPNRKAFDEEVVDAEYEEVN